MSYHIDTIDLKEGQDGAHRDLKRSNVTFYPHGLRVSDKTFFSSVMHESPQEKNTLQDVVEFALPFAEAPPEIMQAMDALQKAIESHYLSTVYKGATLAT